MSLIDPTSGLSFDDVMAFIGFKKDNQVDTFQDLPVPAIDYDGEFWVTNIASDNGQFWPFKVRYSPGWWKSAGGVWNYRGPDVPSFLVDDLLAFVDDATGNKLGFILDDLTDNRMARWQDKDYTGVADLLDFWKASISSASGLINQTVAFEPFFIRDSINNVNAAGVWSVPIPAPIAGNKFKLSASLVTSYNDGGQDLLFQILVNGAPVNDFLFTLEPKDVGGGGLVLPTVAGGIIGPTVNSGTSQRLVASGFGFVNLNAGNTIELQFAGSTTNDEATIYSANLMVEHIIDGNA